MSTHCLIARPADEGRDGQFELVYCHFDGYPAGVGNILQRCYTKPMILDVLFRGGHLSFLAESILHNERLARTDLVDRFSRTDDLLSACRRQAADFLYFWQGTEWLGYVVDSRKDYLVPVTIPL